MKHLAEAGLIDKVAMDIKACPDNYRNLTGIEKPDMDSIFETADFYFMENWTMNFGLQLCGNCIRRKILKKLQSGLRSERILPPGL